jgi:hypothetical protein
LADKKISQLNNLTGANLAENDEFVLVDTSADETKAIRQRTISTAPLRSGLSSSQWRRPTRTPSGCTSWMLLRWLLVLSNAVSACKPSATAAPSMSGLVTPPPATPSQCPIGRCLLHPLLNSDEHACTLDTRTSPANFNDYCTRMQQ